MPTLPNFIIFGAPRSGTTSTYHYLRQHPEIVMSFIKETQFFTYLASQATQKKVEINGPWPAKTLSEYQAQFHSKLRQKIAGEATAQYFYVPGVPEQIKAYLPNIHLICILRNPIERAYSHYLLKRREGLESRSFEDAIQNELKIIRYGKEDIIFPTNYYLRSGYYFQTLNRYFQYFDPEQITIYFYDDLSGNSVKFARQLYADLGVDESYTPDTSVRFNQGGIPPGKKLIIKRLKPLILSLRRLLPEKLNMKLYRVQLNAQNKALKTPELSGDTKKFLQQNYADDIQNLQEFSKRDLSHWINS